MPLAVLRMTGVVGDAVTIDPTLVIRMPLARAAVPSVLLYLRWRL